MDTVIINTPITPLLWNLDDIYKRNRKCFSGTEAKMLFNIIMDFLKYWRDLEAEDFKGLDKDATDELYYYFTEKLRCIFDSHLDLYYLIHDIDGKPLYSDGRDPEDFWMTRVRKKATCLRRIQRIKL